MTLTLFFYHPIADTWTTLPRTQAVELAERLIVIAEMNPILFEKLRECLGWGWFIVEEALKSLV